MGFIVGTLLGLDLIAANLPGLALTILISSFSTCGLGLMLGSISLTALNVMFINNMFFSLLLVFSEANLQLDKMPVWIQSVSKWLPLTRSIQSARLLVNGATLNEVSSILTSELAIGLTCVLAGFIFFRWFEFHARKRGTLEAF